MLAVTGESNVILSNAAFNRVLITVLGTVQRKHADETADGRASAAASRLEDDAFAPNGANGGDAPITCMCP